MKNDAEALLQVHSFYKTMDPMILPSLRVADAIKVAVLQKIVAPGESIPSTSRLAQQIGVNQMTAVKALQEVVALGIIQRSRGSNHVVCKDGAKICAKIVEGEILGELRHLYHKMTNYLISPSTASQWLRGFEEAEKSLGKIK